MRNEWHLARAMETLPDVPRTILEIGAGDGTFMLKLARRLGPPWREPCQKVRLYLLDRKPVVKQPTLAAFNSIGWQAEVIRADLRDWLAGAGSQHFDLITANLFLHHFRDDELGVFFAAFAELGNTFMCCEPRRWRPAVLATRLLWCIGCNYVTRHDALISVRAGFQGRELSKLWPGESAFKLHEEPAGLASHLFVATRR